MFLLCCCIALGLSLIYAEEGPIVDTTYGQLHGSYETNRDSADYEQYLGIPYAAPPIAELRWEKPIPPEPWYGVRNATEFGSRCVQIYKEFNSSEDCLFLNVYVPGNDRVGDNLAVMLYIHGGGFFVGSSNPFPAYDLAITGDVIVITMNYRLGPIGFLSTEDDAAPGNYGLWDVHAALQWIQDNIQSFGGDINRVTVFGQSAGGAMTSHIMVSPPASGLLNRGVCLSGQSSGPFGCALKGKVKAATEILGNFLGCRRVNDSYELVDCLREVPAPEVDFWGFVLSIVRLQQLPNFIPVVDGEFIPKPPGESWADGVAKELDLITGRTEHDGHFAVTGNLFGYPENRNNFAANETILDGWLHYQLAHYPETEAAVEAVYEEYPLLKDNDTDVRTLEATQQFTDFWFSTYAHKEAKQHASFDDGSTYLYNFRYRQSFVQYPYEWVTGSHGDDMYSMFGYDINVDKREELEADFTAPDFLMSELYMIYFTNFAKTGNPNEGNVVPVPWPSYNNESKSYMEFSDNPRVAPETSEMLDTYEFWSDEFLSIAVPENNGTFEGNELENELYEYTEQDVIEIAEIGREYLVNIFAQTEEEMYAIDLFVDEALENQLLRMQAYQDLY